MPLTQKRNILIKWGAIFSLILSTHLMIQAQFNNCLFEHYSTDDGLSHGTITAILKDSEGFMWFGTMDGINRFDGYNFKTFKTRPGDEVSLSSNRIVNMVEDHFGFLWIKTYDARIYRFNKQKESFENVLDDVQIDRVFLASKGDVWLTTSNKGVYRIESLGADHTLKASHFGKNILLSDTIIFLGEDTKNRIWVSTSKGANCLEYNKLQNQYTNKPYSPGDSLYIANQIFQCYFDYKDDLFFGTKQGSVFIYNSISQKFTKVNFHNESPVSTLSMLQNKNLIIATNGNGIFSFDLNSNTVQNHLNNDYTNKIAYFFVDSRDNIWLETRLPGVLKLDSDFKNLKHFEQVSDVSPTLQIRSGCSFAEDRNKVLWINLKGSGFGYFNEERDQFEYFYNEPGARERKMSNFVTNFFPDSSGILWLSTYYKGIEKIIFPGNRFKFTPLIPGAQNRIVNEVRSLYEDGQTRLWVGTKEGVLYILDTNYQTLAKFSRPKELQNGLVYSFLEDSDSTLWLGTKGQGLFKAQSHSRDFHKFEFIQYKHSSKQNSLSSDNVYSVIEDSKKRIWIATYGGGINLLVRKNDSTGFKNSHNSFFNYPKNDAFKCRQVLEDYLGNIWLATTNGLVFFNPNTAKPEDFQFKFFKKKPGLKSSLGNNDVLCIFKDKNDTLWFGTMGGGLHKLIQYPTEEKPAGFKIYSRSDGLPSDVILSIVADEKDNLWMSTENGLSMFNPETEHFRNYDENDGISNTSFSENTAFRKESGEILFGSFDGIYSFFPDSLKEFRNKINLRIIDFQILSESKPGVAPTSLLNFDEEKKIHLSYHQNMFGVEYVALDYRSQHTIEFAYILEGFEENWHYSKSRRIASYTNIPPGKYQFKVKLANLEMESFSTVQSLQINIAPPPWKTFWAYLIYMFLGGILILVIRKNVITIIRLRHKVVIEQEMTNLKLRFFTNISHELRTPLTLILGPISELAAKEKLSLQGREYIQLLDKNARRMLRLINQLLDFRKLQNKKMKLKPVKVDIVSFLRDVAQNFSELAKQKKVEFGFHSSVDQLEVWIDTDKLDIVIFNLLSNAIKFTTEGNRVDIRIDIENDLNEVHIEVKDQGVGIPKEKADLVFSRFSEIHAQNNLRNVGTGIGLSLSKELVELHGGTINFESKEHEGTSFIISLKLGKEHFDHTLVQLSESSEKQSSPEKFELKKKPIADSEINTALEENAKEGLPLNAQLLLIVEDNDELRQFIALQFRGNFRIEQAANGMDGFAKAIEFIPDIIISDIMMPGTDGLELTDKLKNNFETSHIPIILLTAKSALESKIEGLKYGADDYITKPFESEYLKARVFNILEQRKLLFRQFSGGLRQDNSDLSNLSITNLDEEFLQDVLQVVNENIAESDFNIEKLANELSLGRTSFYKKLKSLTGVSPIEFLNDLRLQKSATLLRTNQYNISEVAYMVGFSDPGYFTKCFKEKFETTPTAFQTKKND